MKIALIMRGLPGSGKSTVAKNLAGSDGVVHSTDNYFYVGGEYVFDPLLLGDYHDKNFADFCVSLDNEVPVVVCDNTNIKRWQFKRYYEAAESKGYLVAIVTMPHPRPEVAEARCVHGVPRATIKRMISGWEL